MLQSCSSSPPHTSPSQSQSFSKDSYLKQSWPQEVQLCFIESTCFRRGKLFILSMCVLSFLFFSFLFFLLPFIVCLFLGIIFIRFLTIFLYFKFLSFRRFSEILLWYVIAILLQADIEPCTCGQIWRVYVIYGRNWIVFPPCVRTINAVPSFRR